MNDVNSSLKLLESILEEARRDDMTFAEKAGLFAAASITCDNFRTYINEKRNSDPYQLEKVSKYKWHIGAMLGFEIDNGHDKSTHTVWCMGQLESLNDRDYWLERCAS